jgi:hypothetical protein
MYAVTMSSHLEFSPQDRLALSRRAILRHMTQESGTSVDHSRLEERGTEHDDSGNRQATGTWALIKHALNVWWRNHPAHIALELAEPALKQYAQKKPVQLLLTSAATGAALVLVRPWRLVSMTGLMLSTLKSSQLSTLALSLLSDRPKSTTNTKDSQ